MLKPTLSFGLVTQATLPKPLKPRNSTPKPECLNPKPQAIKSPENPVSPIRPTYSLHCSSFLGLPFRILDIELV